MDFVILYYLRNPQNLRANSFCPTDHTDKHRFLSYSIICVRIVFVTQMSQITQII